MFKLFHGVVVGIVLNVSLHSSDVTLRFLKKSPNIPPFLLFCWTAQSGKAQRSRVSEPWNWALEICSDM